MHFLGNFSGLSWSGPNCNFWVNFRDFFGWRDFVFPKGRLDPTLECTCQFPLDFLSIGGYSSGFVVFLWFWHARSGGKSWVYWVGFSQGGKPSSNDSQRWLAGCFEKRDLRNLCELRGPAAILFISHDTFSDSIAKILRACFPGVSHKYRAICCKMGYRTDMSV